MFHQDSFMDSTRVPLLIVILLLLVALFSIPSKSQEAADTSATVKANQPSWGEGELIELESVRIEGEIAQPNVVITVARQEPVFREITLEWTPAEELTDFGITPQSLDAFKAIKIKDWSEMLNKPRQ